jgi:single-stranded DNA-binding protein
MPGRENLNHVTLSGNLTRDPVLATLPSGAYTKDRLRRSEGLFE